MFVIIRIVIACVFFISSFVIIKKSKAIRKKLLYIVFASISLLLMEILPLLPFENLFLTFDTAEESYRYYNLGKSDIDLIVEGNDSDFIVDRKNDTDTYLIVPKVSDGYKIGVPLNDKKVAEFFNNEVIILVFNYKNTSDYYVTVYDTNGGESVISDEYNTEFYSLAKKDDFSGKTYVVYFGHITDFNPQYKITVNGNEIVLDEK